MCGITALYEPTAPAWLADTAQQMTQLVRHRGPDGEGLAFFTADGTATAVLTAESPAGVAGGRLPPSGAVFVLGHRRLSILDLTAAGHQPMTDPAGDVWLTFNGEIYNYLEIRAELSNRGHHFHTGTDTEVILAAWREWGAECLSRFNGMFAFVLLDRRSRRVFAARDRFGIKPLYLWRTPDGGIAFASEIKQFTAHPRWRARVNGQRAYDFINWGTADHTAETMFDGVMHLRGGEFLLAPLTDISVASPQRWYQLAPANWSGSFEEAGERLGALLGESIRLRLRADVPVGSCLSGGLDSSAIVATISAELGTRATGLQNTFSAYSDVPRFDERGYAQEVATAVGARQHYVIPDFEQLLAEFRQLVWHQDEPFGSTSIFAQWCVFRLARANGVMVMLDGQGADEALGGYHGYFAPRLAGLLCTFRIGAFWREAAAIRQMHQQPAAEQVKLVVNELAGTRVKDWLRSLVNRTVRRPEFLDLAKLGATADFPRDGVVDFRAPVRSLGLAQISSLNLPLLLHWEDRDSMAHSVEARLPFLDYRLVEFCLGLPEEYKLRDGWTKRVLREAMRGRLPERVRTRRDKLGFATAEETWMRNHPTLVMRMLDDAIETAQGILTPAARTRVSAMLAGKLPFNFLPWRLISFGQWIETFNVRSAAN